MIFDLETVYDAGPVVLKAAAEAVEAASARFGLDLQYPPREEVLRLMGQTEEEFFRELGLALDVDQLEYVRSVFSQAQEQGVRRDRGHLYPGARETLEELKEQGYQVALSSSGSREFMLSIVDHYGLDAYVDISLCLDDVGMADRAALFQEIVNHQDVFPGEAMVVARHMLDFLAARAAALRSIACGWGYGDESELDYADRVATSFHEVRSAITHPGPEAREQ